MKTRNRSICVTVEEARSLRCCGPEGCGFTDPRQDDCQNRESWCIGDTCMGWQWSKHTTAGELSGKPGFNKPKGYCGLAANKQ